MFSPFRQPARRRTAVSERRRRRRRRRRRLRLSLSALKQRSLALSDRQNRTEETDRHAETERRGGAQSLSLTLAALLPSRGRHYVFTFGLKQDGERRRTAVAAATDYKLLARRSRGGEGERAELKRRSCRPSVPPSVLTASDRRRRRCLTQCECVEWSRHYLLRVLRRSSAVRRFATVSPPLPLLSLSPLRRCIQVFSRSPDAPSVDRRLTRTANERRRPPPTPRSEGTIKWATLHYTTCDTAE